MSQVIFTFSLHPFAISDIDSCPPFGATDGGPARHGRLRRANRRRTNWVGRGQPHAGRLADPYKQFHATPALRVTKAFR
jgi:hypothetical protein